MVVCALRKIHAPNVPFIDFFAGVYAPIGYYCLQFTLRCREHTSSRGDVFVFFQSLIRSHIMAKGNNSQKKEVKKPKKDKKKK